MESLSCTKIFTKKTNVSAKGYLLQNKASQRRGFILLKSFADYKIFAARCISIKSFSSFHSQFFGCYHVHQKGTGCILGIAKAIVQNVQDAQANIQADKVRQL